MSDNETPLQGHYSEATAYTVDDYPYGARLRCRIRYYLESNAKNGVRFVSQTEHPVKKVWNAPKKSTYARIAGAMYLDDKGHVQWTGIGEYSSHADVLRFVTRFPYVELEPVRAWAMLKLLYSRKGAKGEIAFTINGARQPVTPADIEDYARDVAAWEGVLAAIRGALP